MTTSYPGALDAFTNPTSGDDLNTVGVVHSAQHANLNDAVEAIEGELGANPSGAAADVAARFSALDTLVGGKAAKDARVFDAVAYGAVVNGSTDDTAAWQAAINAAGAAGGGVVTSSLNGVSIIGGALQDTSGANAQLLLPSLHALDDEQISITIRGLTQPPPIFSVVGATTAPNNHLVLKSTLASGTGAVIGAKGPTGSFQGFTFVHLRMQDLTVRTVSNPTITALDLRRVCTVDLDGVIVDAGTYQIDSVEPTTTTSYGIRMPMRYNGAHNRLGMVDVASFYTGYEFAEHATGVKVAAWGCKVGAEFDASDHASVFLRFMAVHCVRGIKVTGAHAFDIWQYDIEHLSTGWSQTTYDLDDASNFGKGFIRWHAVLGGTGDHNSFTVNGASGFTTSRVGAAIGGSSGISVQDENGTAITGVTQLDFQGAGVTAASGTGEVVVTIPGGAGYVYRDRLVASSGHNLLTLGATPVANSPLVWVNGTIKWPTTDYTISSNVITFNTPLAGSDVVAVQYHSAASSASASALSGGVNILDDFNRANSTSSLGTTSTGAKTWTQHSGTWGISSNLAYVSAATTTNLATVDSAVTDCTVSVTLTVTGLSGLVVRSDGAGNAYVVEVSVGASYAPKIYKATAGSYAAIATGSATTVAAGSVLSVVLVGNTITVKDDGVTIVSVTDSTWSAQTRHGLYATAGVVRFNDFSILP